MGGQNLPESSGVVCDGLTEDIFLAKTKKEVTLYHSLGCLSSEYRR